MNQYLRGNPMPTKRLSKQKGWGVVERNCIRTDKELGKRRYVAIPEIVSYKDTKLNKTYHVKQEYDFYEVLNILNNLTEDNNQLRNRNMELESLLNDVWDTINKRYVDERTALGKSVLKQLIKALDI